MLSLRLKRSSTLPVQLCHRPTMNEDFLMTRGGTEDTTNHSPPQLQQINHNQPYAGLRRCCFSSLLVNRCTVWFPRSDCQIPSGPPSKRGAVPEPTTNETTRLQQYIRNPLKHVPPAGSPARHRSHHAVVFQSSEHHRHHHFHCHAPQNFHPSDQCVLPACLHLRNYRVPHRCLHQHRCVCGRNHLGPHLFHFWFPVLLPVVDRHVGPQIKNVCRMRVWSRRGLFGRVDDLRCQCFFSISSHILPR